MTEFKEGDRVICLKRNTYAPVGEIGTVVKPGDFYSGFYINWDRNVGGHNQFAGVERGHGEWTGENNIMLLDEFNELVKNKELISLDEFRELKVGDYVKIRNFVSGYGVDALFNGLSVKIKQIQYDCGIFKDENDYWLNWFSIVEKVVPQPLAIGETGGVYNLKLKSNTYGIAYIPNTKNLVANNSQPFRDIVKNNYVIINLRNNRIENNLNPHIKEKLDEAHIINYRIDGNYSFIITNKIEPSVVDNDDCDDDDEESYEIGINVNFSNGEFSVIEGEGANYAVCLTCGRKTLQSNIFGKYCRRCLTKRTGLAYRFDYHDYSDGYPAPAKVDTTKTPIFGCEIERDYKETNDFSSDLTGSMLDIVKIFNEKELEDGTLKRGEVFMYDGSLNNGGLEWITFPHSFDWYVKNKDKFDKAISAIREKGFTNTKRAGNHIHINRSYFGNDAEFCACKIALLFNTYWNEFVALAGRNINECRYTQKPNQSKDDSLFEVVSKTIENRRTHEIAVNLQHSATIEIRLWSAIKNADDLIFFLDNTQALARFVKKASLEKIQKAEFTDFMKYYKLKSSIKMAKEKLSNRRITKWTDKIKKLTEKVGK